MFEDVKRKLYYYTKVSNGGLRKDNKISDLDIKCKIKTQQVKELRIISNEFYYKYY